MFDPVVSLVLVDLLDLVHNQRPSGVVVVEVHVNVLGVFGQRWEDILKYVNVAAQKNKKNRLLGCKKLRFQ